ncbi:MAG: hypothetical protein IKQ46_12880 [Bacteroidales bacterium]|nr:hypothetical protein [Bacteroidales bacterium]
MEKNSDYKWKFSKIGDVTRVSIETGDDIKHLPELDTKMWTVLSCPRSSLEFDQKTLDLLDVNKDGKIRVNEVVKASEWLCKVLVTPDLLVKQPDTLKLSDINQETEEGKKIYNSAKEIIQVLNLGKEELNIEDTKDLKKIFSKTPFPKYGVVSEKSTDDVVLKDLIALVADKIGFIEGEDGLKGIDKDHVEAFYKELADYSDWKKSAVDLCYGDNTEAAINAFNAIKLKIQDYFVRCKMVAFNKETYSAMELPIEQLAQITTENLSEKLSELAKYPIARISDKCELPLNGEINPAWENAFAEVKRLIFDVDFAGKTSITEAEFLTIEPKLKSYQEWISAKKGAKVESVGLEKINQLLAEDNKSKLLALIEEDTAKEKDLTEILAVDSLLHCCKYFFSFLRNFVTFSDFYTAHHEKLAMFQAGKLFIDQRECDLTIKVTDMPKHDATATASGMFLVYCDCVSSVTKATMKICAVVTDGENENIMVGKNAIFVDRDNVIWDATVFKVIENPISIREAFWAPYKKFVKFAEDQINKIAASKDKAMTEKASASIADTSTKLATTPAPAADGTAAAPADPLLSEKKQAFDIAKFCGIFAAIGMALGYIGGFLVSVVTGFASLKVWQMVLAILGILLLISGPSMLIAYLKLRRRNLSPLLNANGWAVNAQSFVNILFGATLTHIAKFPILNVKDPLADKGYPKWKIVLWVLFILVIVGLVLYCNGYLTRFGLSPEGIWDFTTDPIVKNAADTLSH